MSRTDDPVVTVVIQQWSDGETGLTTNLATDQVAPFLDEVSDMIWDGGAEEVREMVVGRLN